MSELILDPGLWKIVWLSFRLSILATAIASVLAMPTGLFLALREFPGKRQVVATLNTLLGLPTVVIGLLVYSMIGRSGPLGGLSLLFTPTAIVIGQVILALPIITSLTHAAVEGVDKRARAAALSLGAGRRQADLLTLSEARVGILAATVAGFGRVVSEVGSVIMLGGNIEGHTRTITTAIVLETSKGHFHQAALLAVVLLAVALGVNLLVHRALLKK